MKQRRRTLLVKLDSTGEEATTKNEEEVGQDGTHHRRPDDLKVALNESEDGCARRYSARRRERERARKTYR
jgi:hypothetical protein